MFRGALEFIPEPFCLTFPLYGYRKTRICYGRIQKIALGDGMSYNTTSPRGGVTVTRQAHNLKIVGANPTPATAL